MCEERFIRMRSLAEELWVYCSLFNNLVERAMGKELQ